MKHYLELYSPDEVTIHIALPGHTFHETLRAKAQHIFLFPTLALARKIARAYVKATGCPATTYQNKGTGATNRHNWKRCPESGKVISIPF